MALRTRLHGTVSLRRGVLRRILLWGVNKAHGNPHAVLDLFAQIRVATKHLLGGFSTLSKALALVGIPGARLINDVLLDAKVKEITTEVLRVAANAIASVISEDELNPSYIIPGAFDKRVAPAVSKAVRRAVRDLPTVDIPVQPDMDVN